MIGFVPQYYGWLGNQMFQYACVKALSLRMGVDCSFPEKEPNLYSIFNLSSSKDFKTSSGRALLYKEPQFTFNSIPHQSPDMILEGYFQSDKYFKDFESEIRKEFTFKEKPVGSIPRGSCSIHVRRGDYVKLKDYHPLCSLDYYKKAMTLIPSEKYLVFSDDPSWCEDAFDQENVEVVRGNSAEQDLQLMSLCDNHIIANSSFSWWGAWLNASSEKKVVAPSKWFGPSANLDFKDVYCKDWILV